LLGAALMNEANEFLLQHFVGDKQRGFLTGQDG